MCNEEKSNVTSYGLTTAIFIAVTFGTFAPIELFFVNINDLWFDIYDILPGLLLITLFFFLICFGLIWGAYKLFWNKATIWKSVIVVLGVVAISLYMQGNFFQAEYEKVGTETIDWSKYTTEGILNVVGWVGMLAIFGALLYKLRLDKFLMLLKNLMIMVLLIQVSTLVIVAFVQHGLMRKNDYVATTEDEWKLSKNKNFITLVLDSYDARIFDVLLNSKEGDEYKNALEDFTFYRNTLTVFTLTDFSIPQILTGEKYLNQENYGPFIERAYNNSPFLGELKSEGYDMNIYTTVTLPQTGIVKDISNWHKVDSISSDNLKMFRLYYKLILFRYLPHYLKPYFEIDLDEFDDLEEAGTIDGRKVNIGVDPDTYSYGNIEFIEGISQIAASDSANDFRFYHIKGIHHTRDLDRNLNEIKDFEEDSEGVPLEESARACMAIIDLFLEQLKSEGIFDDSVIVIMADHGAASYEGGGYIQSPILCIKGFDEKHEFRINEAPVSYEDLQTGFINLLNGKTGVDVFDVKEGEKRTRIMYYTGYIGKRRKFTKNEPFIEYQSTGHAFDLLHILRTGVEY